MKNTLVAGKDAEDILRRIDRVLRDLGNPEPPLRLELVRDLLRLDRQYYSAKDDGILRETVHRIRVAGIQILKRPLLLLEAIKKADLKALYLPDQRRILLDKDRPTPKQRWDEGHEITHSLLPWHAEMMLGDTAQTRNVVCQQQLEAEANFGAGRLLFLGDRFVTEARDWSRTLASVQKLHRAYGNTITTTLWRFVELAGAEVPIVGLVTAHPHPIRRPAGFDPTNPSRHTIQSPAFARRFSRIEETALFNVVASYCGAQTGGPLGRAERLLHDDNGAAHIFEFETFYNRYDALSLGVYARPHSVVVSSVAPL